jgi:hypothetical protein
MTRPPLAISTTVRAAALLGVTLLSAVLLAPPAAGAPPSGGPNQRASCVGQVFVPQATGEPGQVADRIHEIMEVDLPTYGGNFGQAISGLARDRWCRGD